MGTLSDAQFRQQTNDEGGASRQINTLQAPMKGYVVGGANFKERKVPVDKFTQKTVGDHLAALQAHFGMDPTIHQGSWRTNGSVALDASDVVSSKVTAMDKGIKRHEQAIYDLNQGRDVPLPKLAKVKIKRP